MTDFYKQLSVVRQRWDEQAQADGVCDNDCEHCIWTECPKDGDDYKYIKEISKPTGITFEQANGDLISKTELLKALDSWDKFGVDDTNSLFRLDNLSLPHYVPYIHYDDVVKCIKGMPSVAIPNKVGHWVERRNRATGHIESVCSECEAEEGYPYNDYCGNCGAKMD